MRWIYDDPNWIMAILFVATFVAVTWIGIFPTPATIRSRFHREQRANKMVGLAQSSYFVLFGPLLGLPSVATYQNYSNVGDIVDEVIRHVRALPGF